MLDKFWGAAGEKLGENWMAALLQPALAFWAVGLLAWVDNRQDGWAALLDGWHALGSTEAQVAVLAGALLGILASSVVMRWVQRDLLRLLEGYWPRWANSLFHRRCEKVSEKLGQKMARWQVLAKEVDEVHGGNLDGLRAADREEYARLDREILLLYSPEQRTPLRPEDVLPTPLGNRLKAAEDYSRVRYGLDAVLVWPRLWPLLPDGLRADIAEARARLNAAVRLVAWGVLACLWAVWAWWALPLGVVAVIIAWFRALSAAEVYGDLIRTAFDLHRFDLYKALRWPLPAQIGAPECNHGKQLTQYLFRGLTDEPVRLAHSANAKKKED